MTVHFIGAGPGAPDLLTLRGRDLIAASPVCLYAGSLVPEGVLAHCPPGARIVNTAPLSLQQIVDELRAAHGQGLDVARLHSGDLSVWSAMGEQLRALREAGIAFTVTPGVPSFAAAAAALEGPQDFVAKSVAIYRERRDSMAQRINAIPGLSCALPDGAFYLYADVSRYTNDSLGFCRRMLEEAGIAATPGLDFDTGRGASYVRFSFAGRTEAIADACDRLDRWLK